MSFEPPSAPSETEPTVSVPQRCRRYDGSVDGRCARQTRNPDGDCGKHLTPHAFDDETVSWVAVEPFFYPSDTDPRTGPGWCGCDESRCRADESGHATPVNCRRHGDYPVVVPMVTIR